MILLDTFAGGLTDTNVLALPGMDEAQRAQTPARNSKPRIVGASHDRLNTHTHTRTRPNSRDRLTPQAAGAETYFRDHLPTTPVRLLCVSTLGTKAAGQRECIN